MLSKETMLKFTERVPEFINMYGITETLTLTSNFPNDTDKNRRLTSVGFPIAHVEVYRFFGIDYRLLLNCSNV